MKKALLLIISLFLTISVFAETEAILKLDTGGHKALIRELIVTADGNRLISASDDKTIRVWRIDENGKSIRVTEERKILGQIGSGSEGKIYAIALSKDDKFLAVGGFLAGEDLSDKTAIRVYNFQTGKLLQILKSHSNVVFGLSFSADGKYLVSGSGDKSVKIWKKSYGSFELEKTFKEHSKQVYDVKIFKKGYDYRIVSAGYDNKINLYSLQNGLIKSYTHSEKLQYIAVSSDYITTCGDGNKILIFNKKLSLIKTITSETEPSGLAFSPDERYLLAGTGNHPMNCNVYKVNNNFEKMTSFKKHTNLTMAVTFLNNSTAITGGGSNNEIYLWDIYSGEVKAEISGKGSSVWSVGISGQQISFANTFTSARGKSDFEKIIDLSDFSVMSFDASQNYRFDRIPTQYGNYKLDHAKGGDYGRSDAILQIERNSSVIKEIVRTSYDGIRHRCYGITENGIIISGGSNGFLTAYNLSGDKIADFKGHTGEVWGIAVENNILVSGSYDQTIKLWDLSGLSSSSNTKKTIYPYLNIFVSKDNEWVVWSESGYYNCSVGGDKFVGYHINNGSEKAADYFSSDRFYKTYFQPLLIENLITLHNEEKALAFTQKKKRVETVAVQNILPPKIELNCQNFMITTSGSITIDFYVIPQSDNKITDISIFLNGRNVNERGIKLKKQQTGNRIHITKEISIIEKENKIKLIAANKYAVSNPVFIDVIMKQPKIEDIYKPSLYLLAIGISDYENDDYDLNFADVDAETIVDIFKDQTNLYQKVDYKLLTNKKANKNNILDGIDWLMKEATQNDVVILYLAGHGINDANNNFYYLSYEADLEALRRSAVRFTDFEDVITSLPSKVILMTDACHSGNIFGSRKRRSITTALKDLQAAGSGQIIMTATTDNAVAYEDKKWGHGAFTKALKDGLKYYKADYDNDGTITIKELDFYITNRVKELTNGKQKPTTIIPESVPDFPIMVK